MRDHDLISDMMRFMGIAVVTQETSWALRQFEHSIP